MSSTEAPRAGPSVGSTCVLWRRRAPARAVLGISPSVMRFAPRLTYRRSAAAASGNRVVTGSDDGAGHDEVQPSAFNGLLGRPVHVRRCGRGAFLTYISQVIIKALGVHRPRVRRRQRANPVSGLVERARQGHSSEIQARVLRFETGNLGAHKDVGAGVLEARLDFGPGYRVYFGRKGRERSCFCCVVTKARRRRTSSSHRNSGRGT